MTNVLKKCMIPISVDNAIFGTATFSRAFEAIATRYDTILFLVADQLQAYNKASRLKNANELSAYLIEWRSQARYLEERRTWILRTLSASINSGPNRSANVKWQVAGLDEFTDREFYSVYRQIVILFHTEQLFREDVEHLAATHVAKHKRRDEATLRFRLAVQYLLEEIAVNIRIRVFEGIQDEYYAGENLIPMIRLYNGFYGIKATDLAGRRPSNEKFKFFEFQLAARSGARWHDITDGSSYDINGSTSEVLSA